MMRTMAALAVLALCAAGQDQLTVLEATILYPEGRRGSALPYREAYREARARVRRATGALPPQEVTIELVEDADALSAAAQARGGSPLPDWVAGVALPAHRLIIIRLDLRSPSPVRVEGLLAHELCHVVAHHVVSGPDATPIPRWLDEGLAQLAEGRVFSPETPNLARRAFFGQLLDLSDLESSFPQTEGASALAYAQAESFVGWLAKRGPPQVGIPRLLAALREGHTVKRAFRDTFMQSLSELETDWRIGLRKDHSWMPSAIGQLLLGVLVAIAVVLGASRIVVRRRALQAQWEEEQTEVEEEGLGGKEAHVETHPRPRPSGPPLRIRRARRDEEPPTV